MKIHIQPPKPIILFVAVPFISYYLIIIIITSSNSQNLSKTMQAFSSSLSFAKPFIASPRSYPRVRSQLSDRQSLAVADSKSMAAKWAQKTVVLPPQKRGCHLVTSKVKNNPNSLSFFDQLRADLG